MITSEVTIDEKRCRGCGYCVQLCPRECLDMTKGKYSPLGYKVPVFTNAERCNTCGLCYRVCPHWAIDVYLCNKAEGEAVTREKVSEPPWLASSPPLANCSWCQHPLIGRIIAEVIDELGVNDKAVPIEALNCSSTSAFGPSISRIINRFDRPCDVATVTKRAQPDAIVFLVMDALDIAAMADSFIGALIRGEKFTMIMCTDIDCGPRRYPGPVTLIDADGKREISTQGYPVHASELVATFRGVAYSARGAITSADAYQRTKSYIRTAFQKQIDNVGFSFVEVLSACAGFDRYLTAADCLKQVSDKIIAELPLGEFKNVDQINPIRIEDQLKGKYSL